MDGVNETGSAQGDGSAEIRIERLSAAEAEAVLPDLAAILVDAVASGASVNFLEGFLPEEAAAFWAGRLPSLADGSTVLFVARAGEAIVGTVLLFLAWQPNSPHRGEIGKMLVHSSMRRRGVGERLLRAAEEAALARGRTLLILDTAAGSAGDRLYRRCGWIPLGTVPGFAQNTRGEPEGATFFYKHLDGAP
jgi:GNAT superfamily N-acetyltransferase